MYQDSTRSRVLAALLAVAVAAVPLGVAWAVTDDFVRRDVMPKGARIDGTDVGGLPRSAATRLVQDKVEGPLLRPVAVHAEDRTFELDPRRHVKVDVEGMLDEAERPRVEATLPERVIARVTGARTGPDIPRRLRVDTATLEAWIAESAPQVFRPAVDATILVVASGLRFVNSVPGRTLEASVVAPALVEALENGSKDVSVPVTAIAASFTERQFKKTILVRRSKRRMWLYNGTRLEKTYQIAVGTPGFPTPLGRWQVIGKRFMPTWRNPGSAWAAGMPDSIPPGRGNPLGTRAIDLDASGIRFHGTSKDYSIGTAASHGCMRMHMWDVEDLYPRVPIGTRVYVIN